MFILSRTDPKDTFAGALVVFEIKWFLHAVDVLNVMKNVEGK